MFAPPPIPPNTAQGHRERMRLRLLQAGPDALLDYEMLEMILFLALPRRDTSRSPAPFSPGSATSLA